MNYKLNLIFQGVPTSSSEKQKDSLIDLNDHASGDVDVLNTKFSALCKSQLEL